ncbi:prephenate dehydratase [Bacillus sp. CGMCC 1.16607]|uniref:prephenate dehydratase n=1 Tax=Bacillus sp. CGMCC 1.16607 TaxID=3351842 RepID=UPI00362B0F9D
MKVGFLGPKATFTDLAVRKMFPNTYSSIPYKTIPECFDAVENGEVDIATVPLENALEGSVNITLDYLIHEADLPIRGEISTPIAQHLLVHPLNMDKEITKIYSHSHAIAQCHKYLHHHWKGISSESMTSTAAAAQYISEHSELPIAAIANELAAEEYNLTIKANNIHDYSHNYTRFVILSKDKLEFTYTKELNSRYKTTVMVTLPEDQSGALHLVLSAFAWRKLNLSKIESRPMKTGLGKYFFIIDIEKEMDDVLIPGAIAELEALGSKVKVLGSYPAFKVEKGIVV